MLRPDESLLLNHGGFSTQGRATLQDALGNRAVLLNETDPFGGSGAGSATGGSSSWQNGLVYANTTVPAGNTVANTVANTQFASAYQIPANTLQVGDVIFVRAWGVYGTVAAAPTLTLAVRLQLNVAVTTGAITTVAPLTNVGWMLEAQLHITSLGAGGTVEAQGYTSLSTAATTVQAVHMPNTAALALNTTVVRSLNIAAQWGTANAANTITLRNFSVRIEQAQNFG